MYEGDNMDIIIVTLKKPTPERGDAPGEWSPLKR